MMMMMMSSASTIFTQFIAEATEIDEIAQNKAHVYFLFMNNEPFRRFAPERLDRRVHCAVKLCL